MSWLTYLLTYFWPKIKWVSRNNGGTLLCQVLWSQFHRFLTLSYRKTNRQTDRQTPLKTTPRLLSAWVITKQLTALLQPATHFNSAWPSLLGVAHWVLAMRPRSPQGRNGELWTRLFANQADTDRKYRYIQRNTIKHYQTHSHKTATTNYW